MSLNTRALAHNLAAAIHFWNRVQELPGRALDDSAELVAFDLRGLGLAMLRKERTTANGSTP